MEVNKQFLNNLNRRLDAAEGLFSKLALQEIAKRSARTAQQIANTRHSERALIDSEARRNSDIQFYNVVSQHCECVLFNRYHGPYRIMNR